MKDLLRLLSLMRPEAGWMALAVLLSAAASLSHAGLMAAAGWFIAAMALAGAAGVAMNPFVASALIRAFALLRSVGRYAERLVGHEATLRFVARLRPWFFARLVPLAPAALEDQASGDLLARLKTDIDRMEFAFLRILSPVLAAVLAVAIATGVAAAYDGAVAVALLTCAVLGGLALPLATYRLGAAAARRLAMETGAFEAALVDHVEGAAERAVYDPTGRHRHALDALSDRLMADETRLSTLAAATTAGVGIAAQAALLLALLLGAPLVLAGRLAPADLPLLAFLALATFEAVGPLPLAFQSLPATLASARRLFALADRAPAVAEGGAGLPVPQEGALVFSGVGFTYPGAPTPALEGVDLAITPGRRVAVVGASGSGKSTLVALALRFRAPGSGTITYAGTPVEVFDADALRRRMAVLGQHDHLFAASIADNLCLADADAPAARLMQACAAAGIDDVVAQQPEGFDTFVGAHGAALSGGQARRLALARTLLKPAPLLLLDEPTEGLDLETERRVMDGILKAAEGRALLLVTHRRAGLEAMDEIVAMDGGRIIARGPPQVMLRHPALALRAPA